MVDQKPPEQIRVAVIGAGPQGLCALKNLLEEGFDAELCEARDVIGGLWAFSNDPNVFTTLESTITNVSKLKNVYADFPCDNDFPLFPTQKEFLEYLEAYAEHFELKRRIKFKKKLLSLSRAEDGNGQMAWRLEFAEVYELRDSKPVTIKTVEFFDKVIMAIGRHHSPHMPAIEGAEHFGKRLIHSAQFKRPEDYRNKRVLVLGFANTAGDTATELIGIAHTIYVAHRQGILVLPRVLKGKPVEQLSNRRMDAILGTLSSWFPITMAKFMQNMALKISDQAFSLKPAWGFRPAPSRFTQRVMISDTFVLALEAGDIESVANLKRIIDNEIVELDDGTRLYVDNIICCTGMNPNRSFLESLGQRTKLDEDSAHKDVRLPRLYQNIFPPEYASSIAFLDGWQAPTGICEVADLACTAIVQIFKGAYPLPTIEEMNREIDQHQEWLHTIGLLPNEPGAARNAVQERKWRSWLHDAAGNGMNEYLGWGRKGWWFWLTNWRFCNMLMGGVDSPHVGRLFEGRRKRWEGARKAIEEVNSEELARRKTDDNRKKK
ncbi:FAD/NAD(P)-binding domain-containing protein [Rhizodiscina lignyota]|uniref:FAD/NAD(P)-binding domain-containing protein n=1 Tax=Rhizodiscina lignyota TaxID=1504668 RepID=A0A9P4M7H9_9PEZI|nr:FAD/NAD(P)-binding domain-containing protein [Rhizodiscina lignyota]